MRRPRVPASIAFNALVAVGGRFAGAALGLIVLGLLARLLGAAALGEYVFLLSVGIILQLIADGGLYLVLTRDIAKHPAREGQLIAEVFSLRLLLLGAVYTGGVLLTVAVPRFQELVPTFVVMAIGFACQSVSQLCLGIYQKYGVAWRATLGDLVGRITQLGVLLVIAPSILGAALAFAASSAVAVVLHWLMVPTRRAFRLVATPRAWRAIAALAWPLGLLLVLNVVYFRAGAIVLALFRPPAEVGMYGVAYRLLENLLFFPALLGGLVLPRMSAALSQGNQVSARAYVEQSLRVLVVIGLGVALILTLGAPVIIRLIAGAQYAQYAAAAVPLKILSVAVVITYLGQVVGYALVALERSRAMLWLYAGLTAGNVVVNALTIPAWGMIAAAWTTVATEAVALTAAALIVHRSLPFPLPAGTFVAALAAVVLAAAVHAPVLSLTTPVVALLVSVLVYGVVVYMSGALTVSRLHLLWQSYVSR